MALDTCDGPYPSVDTLGDFDHDTVTVASSTSADGGIATLNQNAAGTPTAVCYAGGDGVAMGGASSCGPASGARFVTGGTTLAGSDVITTPTIGQISQADVGKPIAAGSGLPSGETIAGISFLRKDDSSVILS